MHLQPLYLSTMGIEQSNVTNDARDDQTGKFAEKFPDEVFYDAIRSAGGAAGTQDIADRVGCEYTTAYSRLRSLEDEGVVVGDKVANARLWRLKDEE